MEEYNFTKDMFNKSGHIANHKRQNMSPHDQIITYMKSWDSSNPGPCISFPQTRSRIWENFCRQTLYITPTPKKEKQVELIFKHFNKFKKELNTRHKEGTLNDLLYGNKHSAK